jgi:hypothetical protein
MSFRYVLEMSTFSNLNSLLYQNNPEVTNVKLITMSIQRLSNEDCSCTVRRLMVVTVQYER